MGISRLVVRTVVGGLFIGHGTQKLFGWFGGPGMRGGEQLMDSIELAPPRPHAVAAGLTETAGGSMLVTGLATPFAAAGLIGTMLTAIRRVHRPNGVWNTNGGYEFNLVLIAALLHLVEDGPGAPSLDRALGFRRQGPLWALGALGLGAGASTIVVEVARRHRARGDVQGGGSAQSAEPVSVHAAAPYSAEAAGLYPAEPAGLSEAVEQFGLAP
jgi:putative oxidoreductase